MNRSSLLDTASIPPSQPHLYILIVASCSESLCSIQAAQPPLATPSRSPVQMDQPDHHASSSATDPWEQMKPIIETLYMAEKRKLAYVVREMKSHHGFDQLYVPMILFPSTCKTLYHLTRKCSEHHYKYHFRKWKWSRKVGKDDMPQILKGVKHRADLNKISAVILGGRKVDTKKSGGH
jgi:hypothetical protein